MNTWIVAELDEGTDLITAYFGTFDDLDEARDWARTNCDKWEVIELLNTGKGDD